MFARSVPSAKDEPRNDTGAITGWQSARSCAETATPFHIRTGLRHYNASVARRLLHALVFVVGVLACTYVSVVLTFGTVAVMQWSRRGVPQRAFWVGLSTGAMLVPGIVIAVLSVW